MNNINQKHIAVISGGTGYLGSSVVRELAEQGMIIVLLYSKIEKKEGAQAIIESLPGTSHKAYKCDVTDYHEVVEVITLIEKEVGEIFACVYSVGIKLQRKKLLDSLPEELNNAFSVYAIGGFNFLSACSKKLQLHGKGVLVGVTTAGVLVPEATHFLGGYIPAKYALQGILVMLKEELRDFGIRVYSVAPGYMEGGMNSDVPKAFTEIFRKKSKTQKLTTRESVAKKIAYLCSGDANDDSKLTHLVAEEYGEI